MPVNGNNPYFSEKEAKAIVRDVIAKELLRSDTVGNFRGQATKRTGETFGNTGKMQTSVFAGGRKFNVTLQVTSYVGQQAATADSPNEPYIGADLLEEIERDLGIRK